LIVGVVYIVAMIPLDILFDPICFLAKT